MIRSLIVTALVVTILVPPAAEPARRKCLFFCAPVHWQVGRRHGHRHRRGGTAYDPQFCEEIVSAFNNLSPKELGAFVKAIPSAKRGQARKCVDQLP
jgi:hypothetical protein